MRTRTHYWIVLIAVTVSLVSIASAGSRVNFTPARSLNATSGPKVTDSNYRSHPGRTIVDGASNPELVSDQLAYALMFRLLSDRHTADEKNAAQSYLRMALGCGNCDDHQQRAAQKHIKAFLGVVKQFERRVGKLDRQAQELHDLNGPNPSHGVLIQLNELESQKEVIISELIDSLPHHLDEDGMAKLHQHLNQRVKPKVKTNGKDRQSNCLACHIYR